jgi:thiaminase
MNNYLLQDITDNVIPLSIVKADNKLEALFKALEGLLKDEILTIEDICESIGISLEEITNIKTYE